MAMFYHFNFDSSRVIVVMLSMQNVFEFLLQTVAWNGT